MALTPSVASNLGFPEFVRDVAVGQVREKHGQSPIHSQNAC